jgi:hypothetical protein
MIKKIFKLKYAKIYPMDNYCFKCNSICSYSFFPYCYNCDYLKSLNISCNICKYNKDPFCLYCKKKINNFEEAIEY